MASQMAQAAQNISGMSVSAVLSRRADHGAQFCKEFAYKAKRYVKFQQFFDSVDAVYIATPAVTHGSFIKQAIAAGKPILCEKPLTVSSAETHRLLAHAREANVLLMEAIWTLALPAYQELKASFNGRKNAVLQFDFSYPFSAPPNNHLLDPKNGGVLIDRSVYGYAASIFLLGKVIKQTAWVTHNAAGLDTSAELWLQHAEGARSLISLSFERLGPNRLSISNAANLIELGPSSVAAETVRRVTCPTPGNEKYEIRKPGFRSRLKASSLIRHIRAQLPNNAKFLSFGVSPYVPILQDFLATVDKNRLESETVPHVLSEHIASLTEEARQQRNTF